MPYNRMKDKTFVHYMKPFIAAFVLLFACVLNAQTKQKTRILLIFDASGSMTSTLEKGTRMQAAKKIALKMVDSFKTFSNVELALRVYGHQKTVDQKDCKDS